MLQEREASKCKAEFAGGLQAHVKENDRTLGSDAKKSGLMSSPYYALSAALVFNILSFPKIKEYFY